MSIMLLRKCTQKSKQKLTKIKVQRKIDKIDDVEIIEENRQSNKTDNRSESTID